VVEQIMARVRIRKTALPVWVLLVVTGFLGSCGYHFRPTGEPMGITIESLAIPLMTSTSSEKGFEAEFTKIVREEFISHGRVPLVPEENARFLLIGHVYDIRTEPLSYIYSETTVKDQTMIYEETRRRRLRLRVDVSLVERASGNVIWRETAMETKAGFDVGTDPLANRYTERVALERIARRLAKRIYMQTMERF
jgi:outer membrane lipopolysaccharide assembly protein LptE/RlpB